MEVIVSVSLAEDTRSATQPKCPPQGRLRFVEGGAV